ncbi:MAG: hypothetical protein KatS3mg060_1560 [Dehalococcoidia bacterium]|nr:MAG: hypothetical protein KatS3mg060_1560 [Dehalococcoidia bacterium]
MSIFTERERQYIAGQPLARLATVSREGQPDVAVLAFEFDGNRFAFRHAPGRRTLRHRNIRQGNTRVAVIVDDLPPGARPGEGKARGVKVHGTAALELSDGVERLVVTPDEVWSWGIERPAESGNPAAMRRDRLN